MKQILKNSTVKLLMCFVALVCLVGTYGMTAKAQTLTTDDGYEYEVLEDGTVKITGYTGKNIDLVIPEAIDGKPVTVIGDCAFNGIDIVISYSPYTSSRITSVKLPDSLKVIERYAFNGANIKELVIPDGVTQIGDSAFLNNKKLESVDFPDTLTVIETGAFEGCEKLKSVVIPGSVSSIGNFAFAHCDALESVTIEYGNLGNSKGSDDGSFAWFGSSGNVFSSYSLKTIVLPGSIDNIWGIFPGTFVNKNSNAQATVYGYSGSAAERYAEEDGFKFSALTPDVSYHTHIQTYGDSQGVKSNGEMAGTSGESKRLENIWVKIEGYDALGIQYTTHCQTYGWQPWSCDGEVNGTSGEAKRLEAIEIQLTGTATEYYDVYYRVHAQSYGWLGWAKNGEPSGTAGYGKRLEGIQIVVVNKGDAAPGLNYAGVDGSASKYSSTPYVAAKKDDIKIPGHPYGPNVMYKTHVQSYGWQKWVTDGMMSGTSGQAKRLEGININITNKRNSISGEVYDGDVVYTTHVQKYGWQGDPNDETRAGWKKNGEMSGTSGEAKRLEAICIDLTGKMAEEYDIYYRVHAQSYGWLGWAKNGEPAGTAGHAKRLEGIQIILVDKEYGTPPTKTFEGITSVQEKAYID